MGLLAYCLGRRVSAESYAPTDDFWYNPVRRASSTGVIVTPDTAMQCSAVNACVTLLSGTTAQIPFQMHRRLPAGGKEVARQHPLYDLLHDQPNNWQTSFEWREQGMMSLLFRGNWYNEILPGSRGFVDRLIPHHPDLVTVQQEADYRLIYKVRDLKTGQTRTLNQEQMFHVRGLSANGLIGLSPIDHARETIGLAMAAQEHGSRLFSQGLSAGGVITTPADLPDKKWEELYEQFKKRYGGLKNTGRWMLLGSGMTASSLGMTNNQAQFLQTRQYQVADIARMFGRIPLHMICETEKSTSWGTGIEQQTTGFVTYSLLSWLRRIEQAVSRDLILPAARRTYFAAFNVEGLLRGDSAARGEFYYKGRLAGWLMPNEIREKENMNPIPGLDERPMPANERDTGQSFEERRLNDDPRMAAIAKRVGERLERKALAAVARAKAKMQPDEYTVWSDEFWEKHAQEISDELQMPMEAALCLMHTRRQALAA